MINQLEKMAESLTPVAPKVPLEEMAVIRQGRGVRIADLLEELTLTPGRSRSRMSWMSLPLTPDPKLMFNQRELAQIKASMMGKPTLTMMSTIREAQIRQDLIPNLGLAMRDRALNPRTTSPSPTHLSRRAGKAQESCAERC